MEQSSSASETQYTAEEKKKRGMLAELLIRLVKEKPLGTVGLIIVLALFITGIFADLSYFGFPDVGLAPYGFNEINLSDRLSPPSGTHILGADNLGRDMLSRIIFGARISMYVGVGAIILSVGEATFIGIVSGFFGGKVDIIIQRFVDAWMCFPMLFILLTAMAILSGVMHPIILMILVLGLASGIGASRLVRSSVIAIKSNMYIEASKAIGSPTSRTLIRHILPNVTPVIIIMLSIGMGGVIMAEASLSFLGFGLPPPTPSWGGMLSGSGRTHMIRAPWMMIWPGLVLGLVIYGINMFGDAVRDLLDPRMRGGLGRYSGVEKQRAKLAKKKAQA